MATFTWYAITGAGFDDAVSSIYKYGFYGTNFNDAISVDSYQDSMHWENASNIEQCTGTHINNVKYVSANVFNPGTGDTSLSATKPATGECPILINFTHGSAVATSSATFWADDASVSTNGPGNGSIMCYGIEQSDTSWSQLSGSTTSVSLTDQGSATSHNFYIAVSASPLEVGTHVDFRFQIQLTYQ